MPKCLFTSYFFRAIFCKPTERDTDHHKCSELGVGAARKQSILISGGGYQQHLSCDY